MQSKLIAINGGQRTFALVFDTGDEVMGDLKQFAERECLAAAQISAIGAFSDAVLGYFELDKKDYLRIPVGEQVEVASLTGDVALAPDGSRAIHVHCVLGRRNGAALAGHLIQAHVRPTLEVILTESPAHLQKMHDPETGLALIRLEAEAV
jgi:uncharacterized protein